MARSGKGSSKAERDALRQEMLVSGCSLELIATEMERRWGIRPREAYRHAHGWSQDEVAARFTEVADRIGGDRNLGPAGRPASAQAPMIGTRIGEYERWPNGGRRPSPYVLTVLATVLGTTVERLLDYDDHRKMPDQERTVLAAVLAAASAPVALPPEPQTTPGPGSRPPLGRLTELITSADPTGGDVVADRADEDRPGRGGLTPEQWSAARRLVRRGFTPSDGDAGSDRPGEPPDPAETSDPLGDPATGRAGGAKPPSVRPTRAGGPRSGRAPGTDDLPADPAGHQDPPDGSGTEDRPTPADYVGALDELGAEGLPLAVVQNCGPGAGRERNPVKATGVADDDTGAGTGVPDEVGAAGLTGTSDRADHADSGGGLPKPDGNNTTDTGGAGTAGPVAEHGDTAPRRLGRRETDGRRGAVILPFSPEGSDGPEITGPGRTTPDHDDPPDRLGSDAPPGNQYGSRRLQQRVPQPVPPPLPDPPYIAVTLDPTSPDAAAAARRHRRDRLLATGLHGTGVRSDEEVIMDAAGQSAEFGEWAEGTNVGATTLEQLDDDVRRISRDYLGNPPLPLLLGALRVRNRVFTLLEGRQHPEQTRHLYLTAGRLCGLLGWMASDVGRHGEAETQARTAWLCAELAGSDGLRAWVRATQSKIAYWDGRIQESAGLASDGLRFPAPDSARVLLASLSARAWARLGQPDQAHSALHVAEEERARAGEDEVGGLLGFSEAQQSYMAGSTHLWLREPKEALAASDRAVWLFDVGSQSNRFYGAEMLALVDAASALVQSGDLDGAAERLRPILELPPEQQLDTFTSRLGELRESLRRSRYAASKPAVDIQRQIEEFRAGALGQILGR